MKKPPKYAWFVALFLLIAGVCGYWAIQKYRASHLIQAAIVKAAVAPQLAEKLDATVKQLATEKSQPKIDALGESILALGRDDEAGTVQYVIDYARTHNDSVATFMLSVIKALPLRPFGREFLADYSQFGADQQSQARDILKDMALVNPNEDVTTIDTGLLTNIQTFFRSLATSASGEEQRDALIYYTEIVPSDDAKQFLEDTFLKSKNISETTYQSLAIDIAVSSPDMMAQFLPELLKMFSSDTGIDHNFIINKLSTTAGVISPDERGVVESFLATFKPVPTADPTYYHWLQMQEALGATSSATLNQLSVENSTLNIASFATFCDAASLNTYRSVLEARLSAADTTKLNEIDAAFINAAITRLHGTP